MDWPTVLITVGVCLPLYAAGHAILEWLDRSWRRSAYEQYGFDYLERKRWENPEE